MNQLSTIKDQMLNQFYNLSCYEEFEMRCALTGISKVDVLNKIGHLIDDYYFFISKDGIFNWFDSEGNHVENPGILKELKEDHIPLRITKCIIPDNVTKISVGAFFDCYLLTSITIPNSITNIGAEAFSYCKSLKEIIIPDSVICIGDEAFSCCKSLKEITIPDSVTSIGDRAFYKCESLTSIIIPNSVTNIGNYTFYRCESLTSITIPDSVISIGEWAFIDCKSLKEVIFKGKTLEEVKQMKNYPFGIEDSEFVSKFEYSNTSSSNFKI